MTETFKRDPAAAPETAAGRPQAHLPSASPASFSARISSRIGQTFLALHYPNYRLWFYGQMVSLAGTWMQSTAQAFFIFELTNSPEYLGLVGFAAGVPSWLFSLYGGAVSDRVPRRSLLLVTQTLMMLLAAILAALTFSGLVQPWHILVLAFCLGIANAFDAPARLAIVPELIDGNRDDLTNAIALNATMFNTATAFGPAIAGFVYGAVGPAWCFLINALSFIAVLAGLLLMRLKPVTLAPPSRSAFNDIKIGLGFAVRQPLIRTIMLNMVVVSLFGIGLVSLFPAWAVNILGGDASTNGLLQSARGVGALISALMLASMGRFSGRGRLLTLGMFAFPGLLLAFSLSRWLPLSLLFLFGAGWAQILVMNSSNALLQLNVADDLRGRVMSLFTFAFFGFMPLGALFAGFVAERFSEPVVGYLGAAVMLLTAAFIYWKAPQVRQSG
jgi:MFS family permease